jgi:hypothetical protein
MTDEEVFKLYEDMKRVFGTLPDVDHEPIQFEHKVRMYKHYYMNRNEHGNSSTN